MHHEVFEPPRRERVESSEERGLQVEGVGFPLRIGAERFRVDFLIRL
jgi:hypothetical protein